MMNRSLAQKARKALLRRGRELIRAQVGGELEPAQLEELTEIHAALERIERGSFGRCDGCYSSIELDRLEEAARERYCAECAAVVAGGSDRVSPPLPG